MSSKSQQTDPCQDQDACREVLTNRYEKQIQLLKFEIQGLRNIIAEMQKDVEKLLKK